MTKKSFASSPRLFLTPGEPAGIGPDIVIKIAELDWQAELIAITDPDLLLARAKILNIPLKLIEFAKDKTIPHKKHTLQIIPIPLKAPVAPGILNPDNAAFVLQTLELAANLLLEKSQHQALVTGPVNKAVINQAGFSFLGHTSFFQNLCQVPSSVMLFVIGQLKIALATTHLPLKEVPHAITRENLILTLTTLNQGLKKQFGISNPRILVSGLNPHAGENGYLGREEIEIISPVITQLKKENFEITGPISADTIFTPQYLSRSDAILSMYHDQALPLVKYIGFGYAVNVTLGLPFIRTSVDHGTALEIAGTGFADAGSLKAAMTVAIDLLSHEPKG